jgi:D-alanyl-D-alanine carboxypeptidase
MRKTLKIIGIVLGSLLLVLGVFLFYLYRKTQPEAMARFIRENPNRASVCLVQNDTVFAAQNIDSVMPLASTVKIIVAAEYARQVAAGIIDPAEMIDTATLDRFYIPNTDGDAHPSWLAEVRKKGLLFGSNVPLNEVAKGMIRYSSNANTEYLLDRLHVDSVNAGIKRLGLRMQEPLYPFVASLFISQGLSIDQIKAMSDEKYIAASVGIHDKLKADTGFKRSFKPVTLDMQRVWSDRLPGGTTREYIEILKKINRREYFSAAEQKVMDELMEGILDNPQNRAWLTHAGFKGGSTAFVFTMAMYATSKKGTHTELAYFFNDLSMWESLLLQAAANEFHLSILRGPKTRNRIAEIINGK